MRPRLGEFGFQKNDDAVEGVILMLRGGQTQNVLKAVEAKTEELNRKILPPDVKIVPFYDRSELVQLTTDTVEANLVRGMIAGIDRADLLSGQLPRRCHRCSHDSAVALVCVHRAARPRRRRQSAIDWRD